jgi:hypothetical protein
MSKKKLKKKIKKLDKCIANLKELIKANEELRTSFIKDIPPTHWNKQF